MILIIAEAYVLYELFNVNRNINFGIDLLRI